MDFEAIFKTVERFGLGASAIGLVAFFIYKFFVFTEKRIETERLEMKEERLQEFVRAEKREQHYINVLDNYSKALERNTDQQETFQAMAKRAFDFTADDLKLIRKTLEEQLESMRDLKNSLAMVCTKYSLLKKEHDERTEEGKKC